MVLAGEEGPPLLLGRLLLHEGESRPSVCEAGPRSVDYPSGHIESGKETSVEERPERAPRLRWGELGGNVVAGAGLVAAVTIGLFFAIGQPWGSINDTALLVMTLAGAT